MNSYLEDHKNSGFIVGDLVRVIKKTPDYYNGWETFWMEPQMDDAFNREFIILTDKDKFGFELNVDGGIWCFPCYSLVLVNSLITKEELKSIDVLIDSLNG